jgi:hypothetical protein
MGEKVVKEVKSMMFTDDSVSFKTDEDIQLYIMHKFNIDADTLDCMPACKEPLQSLLWPEKRE